MAAALEHLRSWSPHPPDRPPAFALRLDRAPTAANVIPAPAPHDDPASHPAPAPAPGGGTTIAAAAQAMRAGRLTSRTLVEQSLEAVGRHDARLQAVVHLMAEEALAAAAARDAEAAAGRWRGPLHGIPVTVKDVIDVAGVPT
ncbi:MAG TPA: amidase family protein, partial [Actinomycetota bacterium]